MDTLRYEDGFYVDGEVRCGLEPVDERCHAQRVFPCANGGVAGSGKEGEGEDGNGTYGEDGGEAEAQGGGGEREEETRG